MKHKLLIGLIAVLGLTTAINITNQNVQASKSDDIYMQGFWSKHPTRNFKKWRNVVLTSKTKFMVVPAKDMPQNMQKQIYYGDPDISIPKDRTLPRGTMIKLRSGKNTLWEVKTDKLPKIKYYQWLFNDGANDEIYQFTFATLNSYLGLSALFIPSRKVKVTKPVIAYKIKQEIPAYKNHIVGKTKIKKGTILTVTGPSNHWVLKVSGKGVREHYPYMWNVNKRSGWYKLIN